MTLRDELEPFASTGCEAFRITEDLFDAIVVALRRFSDIPLREFELLFADVRKEAERRLFNQLRDRVHLDDVDYVEGVRTVKLLGIDPGIHGGLAIIDVSGVAPQLIDAIDIPVVGVGAKERVDVQAIRDWLAQHVPQHAFIERAQAMPKQGASSGFKYGRAVGAIEAVITCCAIPLTIIEPAMWKKFHRLAGGDKEGARQRALQLFPTAHALLARKKDHGRAEAALIADYGMRVHAEYDRRELARDKHVADVQEALDSEFGK